MKDAKENRDIVLAGFGIGVTGGAKIFVEFICHSINELGDLPVGHERYEDLVVNINFIHF